MIKAPPELAPGTLWTRDPPGHGTVRVTAVLPVMGRIAVTAHPARGGTSSTYDAQWFCEHYTPEGSG